MVGKSKAICHGINYLRYMSGESKNKKYPEKINFICTKHLPEGMDAMGVWESMQASLTGHDKLKNSLIQVELSPAKEYTKNFTRQDWTELWRDFVEEFDRQIIKDKNGKVKSKQTNIAGSKAVVYLHEESKGGIPHLHGAICRVDENGNVNNDHDIHLRAQRAAEAIARKRGWSTAMDVRSKNVKRVAAICEDVLKSMPRWSWKDFVIDIESAKGENLKVKERTDRLGKIKGYAIIDDDAKYKASELGRNLTYSRLYSTWLKLHPDKTTDSEERPVRRWHRNTPTAPVLPPPAKKKEELIKPKPEKLPVKSAPEKAQPKSISKPDYSFWTPDRRTVDIDIDGTIHRCFLPKKVLQQFDDEFDYREVENFSPLTNLACAYFAALLSPDVPMSTGGGGSSDDKGWGRDKDEDDIEFARRCARMAKSKIGVVKKSRGYHR